ncbi:leucine-rich repeat protein [Limibacterium fermenti]|uniref:leucine-rich repeat protein n=1 Tax=Limibacterium fermenti TaxID=3229863 RepID=UPI003A678C47
MKKIILFLSFIACILTMQAQTEVASTAGGLETALKAKVSDLTTVTNLKITGTIDQRDFEWLKTAMANSEQLINLTTLNLSGASIAAYENHEANAIPLNGLNGSDYAGWKLTSLTLPDNLTKIGERGLQNLEKLESIVIPEGVTEIGQGAFIGSYSLTNIKLPSGLKIIPKDFLNNQKGSATAGILETIEIPKTVESIGDYAFAFNNLYSIDIPASVKVIGSNILQGNPNLTAVNFAENNKLETIAAQTFYGLSLTFENSDFLTNVKEINGGAFYGSTFTTLKPPVNATYKPDASQTLFPFGNNTTIKNLDLTEFTEIPANIFRGQNNTNNGATIGRITFSESLTEIAGIAFGYVKINEQTELIFPSSLVTLGNSSFRELKGTITTLDLSQTQITTLPTGPFALAENVTTFKLPASLTSIAKQNNASSTLRLFNIPNLTDLYVANAEPIKLDGTYDQYFGTVPASQIKLHVPAGSEAKYKAANVWKELTIVTDKAEQTVADFADAIAREGDGITFPAKTDQGLDITYTAEEGKTGVATLSGNKLTVVGVGEIKITAKAEGNDQYLPFEKTITIGTSISYSWLEEVAIAVEGDNAFVAGPAEAVAKFTKFYVDGVEVTLTEGVADISEKSGTIELKATTNTGDIVKLKIQKTAASASAVRQNKGPLTGGK